MGRGLLAGAIWGALVGAVVLMVAALVLEARNERANRPADAPTLAAPAPVPPAPASQPVPSPPDSAAVLSGLSDETSGAAPPRAGSRPGVVTRPDDRVLLPRPQRPVLPALAGAPVPDPALDPSIPPVAAVALVAPASAPDPALEFLPATGRAPVVARSDSGAGPKSGPVPDGPAPAAPAALSARPAAPEAPAALLAGAAAAPDPVLPPGDGAAPVVPMRADPAPVVASAPAPVPAPAARPVTGRALPAFDRPAPAAVLGSAAGAAGARIALVLDGDAPDRAGAAALPFWLMTATAPDAAPFRIALGGPDTDPASGPALYPDRAAPQGYVSDRAAGRAALLAYDRLDTAAAATPDRLAALVARAGRDTAVTVLVAPDPALWAVIDQWLSGPASGLTPVPAVALLP